MSNEDASLQESQAAKIRSPGEKDAFSLLMASSHKKQKKRRLALIRFVPCPVGCGHHFPENDINKHIDKCLVVQHDKRELAEEQARATDAATMLLERAASPVGDTWNHLCTVEEAMASPCRGRGAETDPQPVTQSAMKESYVFSPTLVNSGSLRDSSTDTTEKYDEVSRFDQSEQRNNFSQDSTSYSVGIPNAFDRMMSQAKTVFGQAGKQNLRSQCFHLNKNGIVSLYFDRSHPDEAVAWSTKVCVKDHGTTNHQDSSQQRPQNPAQVELNLSSSIPNDSASTNNARFVRRHSRLSVPVLKSILQKSIRRRKPLPSVRVAMELADKSLGDLLRRLPIIALEDSTLHPDFGLLVWLMISHSKDYSIPPAMLTRVFEIVFEIASCPWCDHSDASDVVSSPSQPVKQPACSLSLLLQRDSERNVLSSTGGGAQDAECLSIWSMLIRAEYGGMSGDVSMLRHYADLWMSRFYPDKHLSDRLPVVLSNDVVLNQIKERMVNLAGDDRGKTIWSHVPSVVHQRAKDQSHKIVYPLVLSGLDCLGLNSLCLQGVDLHVSNVIESVLSDVSFCELCLDILALGDVEVGNSENTGITGSRHDCLESILKTCMWDFGSGVNRRCPLVPSGSISRKDDRSARYKQFWEDLVEPRITSFQKAYLEHRLVQ
jgi:hypothetical protein